MYSLPLSGDNQFDLGNIFIGREQQIDLFHIYLERWKKVMLMTPESPVVTAPSPNEKLQGLVVLLYGRGGFGKSTLLKHYAQIAREQERYITVSKIVDWEFATEDKRSLFNPAPGQEIDAPLYFSFLCKQLAWALEKEQEAFKEYQAAVKAVDVAQSQAKNTLDGLHKDNNDQYGWLRGIAGSGLITLLRMVPGANVVLSDKQVAEKAQEVLGEGAVVGATQLTHVYTRLRNKLGQRLDDYLNPALRLGLALGHDLGKFARNQPLLFLFDTYEEVDEADALLRVVMAAAGARVGWIVAGRDNLWAGMEQRKRTIGKVYGYKDIVPSDRCLAVDFNAGGVGAFSATDIVTYFDILQARLPDFPIQVALSENDAEQIVEVTQGVPLAVKIAAGLFVETADLEVVTRKSDRKREIIDEMFLRYLLHVRDDESERTRLYGLALLRRADEPFAVAAALDLSTEQAKTGYERELIRLHRRYSFIFTEKEQPTLHQEVRYFLRLWLKEHRRNPEVEAVALRLNAAHEQVLQRLEEQWNYTSLRARLEDQEWAETYLDLTEQRFWLDPTDGTRYALPFLFSASIYSRDATIDALEIGIFFEDEIRQPYRRWWDSASKCFVYSSSNNPYPEELMGLQDLIQLVARQPLTFPTQLKMLNIYQKELEAALWWRLGEAYRGRDEELAIQWYEKASGHLNQEDSDFREEMARAYNDRSVVLQEKKEYQKALLSAERAVALDKQNITAYINMGITQQMLKKHGDALDALNHALELDPGSTWAYNNRGNIYRSLREYERALADYTEAIRLDPTYAGAYNNRGNAYDDLKEQERALADYTEAIRLDPTYTLAYYNRGVSYDTLKNYERALADYTEAIRLDPTDMLAYYNRGVIYNTLKDYERALVDYTEAIRLDSTYAAAYNNRGVVYETLKDYERALADYTEAIRLDATYTLAHYNRGMVYDTLKNYERALADYTEAIRLDPTYAAAYNKRSLTYYALKQYKQVIEDCDEAIRLDPTYALAYYNRGVAYDNRKEHERAVVDYTEAIRLDPTYALAYYNRGVIYETLKEYERAVVDYTEVIRLDPTYAFAYYNRGLAYTTLEEYEAALKDYTRSLELNPLDAYIYNDRALVYIAVVEYAKALADFNQAIEIEKDIALFYSNRAWIYGKLAEYQNALIDYTYAIELQPDDASTYISRAYIYLNLQNREEAYKDFVRSAECNQEDVNAAWMVVYASFGKERPGPEVAQRLVEIARIDPQRYEAATCRGIALGLQGKLKEGLVEIEQAIAMSQNEPGQTQDAYFWKGMLCAYIGRNQAAIDAVEKALEAGLPPLLLLPLYWLERDRPEFYERYAAPLLIRYNI